MICRVDFPQILKIATDIPADFQNIIRADFPMYEVIKPDLVIPMPGQLPLDPQLLSNHQFSSETGLDKINITQDFFAYTTTKYPGWDQFKKMFTKIFDIFYKIYHPKSAKRIGVKYTNFLPEQLLVRDGKPLKQYIRSSFVSPFENLIFMEPPMAAYSSTCEFKLDDNDSIARISYGAGTIIAVKAKMFYVETDIFTMKERSLNDVNSIVDIFHDCSYDVFRWVITEELHDYFNGN